METSLHRQLKDAYAGSDSALEVRFDSYRIDVVCGDEFIEIQHGSLAAIRDKIRNLIAGHRVRVVKPIIAMKRLIKRSGKGRQVVDRRMSPKRGTVLELFHELVYFSKVFPHPNLLLEVPLVFVEEWRYPGHGKRRRRRDRDHEVEDQKLIEVQDIHQFRTADDLADLLPSRLPKPFHTQHVADGLNIERGFAQRVAYCLRRPARFAKLASPEMLCSTSVIVGAEKSRRNKLMSRRPSSSCPISG